MKVILSVEPIRYPLTGIGRYTLELANHLGGISDIEEIKYFAGTQFVPNLPTAGDAAPSAPATGLMALKRRLARVPFLLHYARRATDQRRAQSLKGTRDYVYHGPNFYLPPVEGPAVVTIHDLSVLKMPEFHPPERVRFMEKEIELAVQRASRIITDSDFTRAEIADYFGWPIDKVHTTCLGGSAEFFPREEHELQAGLAEYGLRPGQYSLYAGTIEPRKNIERLLIAYEKLDPSLRARYPLILVGYQGWNNSNIMSRIKRAEQAGWAKYLGFAPDGALPLLFAGARLFAFPSHYEGFGLPVLEAMASGTPVICSNAASLPQVAGNAALMSEPEDIETLRDHLEQGLTDETWRANASLLGLEQSGRFSWARCAADTAQVYRLALGQAS